jgi:Uma2 family endonuclease
LDLHRWRYRQERVYVASDLLVYYQEGDTTKFVVPDDFVVLNCDPGRRRTFKIWEEGCAPDVVFEVTSRSSRTVDWVHKPRVYAQIGVKEYFLYDPTSEYLEQPLQGFRLGEGRHYGQIEADSDGSLRCERLGLVLRLAGQELLMHDGQTMGLLRTQAEEADDARQAAELRAEQAELRAAQLEQEIERLRAQQRDQRDGG